MKRIISILVLAFAFVMNANSQCGYDNVQYLSSPAPTVIGTPVELTTCLFGGEYRTVTGMVAGATYRFETCGNTAFDTQLTIYAAGGGASLAYNDDFCGAQSSIDFVVPSSGDYDILLDAYFCVDEATCMTLTATLISLPTTDDCANAQLITCGGTFTGTTATSTLDGPAASCTGGSVAADNWYTIVGTGGTIVASLCGGGTSYDSKLDIYTGTCASLTSVVCNDDFCGLQSEVSWLSTSGTIYYIRVHGFGGGTGAYSLVVTSPIPNDVCTSATTITPGTYTGATVCAAADVAPFCSTGDGTGGGVWYAVTGTNNCSSFTASMCGGTTYDSKIRVFEGTCGALTCVVGNDDFCGLQSQVTWNYTPGTTYYILVHGFGTATGAFTLNLTEQSDNVAPVADVATLADVTSECSVASITAPTATDACVGAVTGTTATVFPITTQGTTVVTWTYDDGNGNTSTQTQNVIIDDVTAPVADAPGPNTFEIRIIGNDTWLDESTWTLADASMTTVAFGGPYFGGLQGFGVLVASVNVPVLNGPYTFAGETQGTFGDNIMTYEVYCNGNLVANGTIAANSTGLSSGIVACDNGGLLPAVTAVCEVTSLTAPTATDNCAGSVTGTTATVFPITTQGTTVVTWTYDDGNGNTSTQTQNVIIDDVTAPVADAATLADVTAECEVTSLTAPTATDNCAGMVTVSNDAVLPITTQGTTVVTWTYDDGNGNTSTQTQNVVIEDVTSPVADVATLADVTAECEVTSLTDPTATDNCGGMVMVSNDAVLPITTQGTTVVTWTYEDMNGNTSTQTQNVVITDVTGPVADVATLADVTAECEVTSLTDPTATDNCGGTVTVSNDAVLPITTQGTTVVTWTYEDENGNTSTQTQNVVIEDVTAPVADVATLADVTATCEVTSLTDPTATDNCGGMVTVSNDAVFPITADATVTWTYEDENGNTSTQTQEVLISGVDATVTVSGATITANNTNTGVTYQWVDCDNANAPISGATSVSFTATADGNYAVEVTEDGCTETSACTLIDLSNVTVLTADLIKVYPNPATSVLNIETTTEGTVGFYDVSGKLIFTQNVIAGTNEMNVDQLATGTYTLRLTTANGIQTIRLVITK
jgi:hypothetical protein